MTAFNLKRRLGKLEASRASKANAFANVILIGARDHDHDDIIGAGSCGSRVWRAENETIEALTARATRELGMQVLFAVYKNGLEAC